MKRKQRRQRHVLDFENRNEPVVSRSVFAMRLARNGMYSGALILASLLAGMAGYHYLEKLEWIDAFANASMILSGMGPLAQPQSWWGKFFAGWYALYSGLVLIFATSLIIAPIFHRLLHRFHIPSEEENQN